MDDKIKKQIAEQLKNAIAVINDNFHDAHKKSRNGIELMRRLKAIVYDTIDFNSLNNCAGIGFEIDFAITAYILKIVDESSAAKNTNFKRADL